MINDLDLFLENLKNTFNKSPEGMVIGDMNAADDPIIFCNDTFLEITGYDRDEIIGRNCRFLQANDSNQAGLELIKTAIKTRQSCRVILRNYRKNGRLFYNRLSLFPILNGKDEAPYYIGLQDDITSFVLSKEQISELEKDKLSLLSEVHHRVKNNLAVVASLLDLERNAESPFQALQKSRMRIKSIASVHENLYKVKGFSRVDFSVVINHAIEQYKSFRENDQAALNYHIDANNTSINVNQAIPLSIILSELIHNVYRHAYKGKTNGEVYILISEEKNSVTLTVGDEGVGVDNINRLKEGKTMGYTLIMTLIRQLNGNITFNKSDKYSGLSVTVSFKKNDKKGSSEATPIL